jgi:hypothetical protein
LFYVDGAKGKSYSPDEPLGSDEIEGLEGEKEIQV